MAESRWKQSEDPLFRGSDREAAGRPTPAADPSIVRHILYLDGYGRETPYLSTTESPEAARHFAHANGAVWRTMVARARRAGVGHRSRKELLQNLRGLGKGDAAWPSAYEVMQARAYVEQWQEHLLDFREVSGAVSEVVAAVFERGSEGRAPAGGR